jgi:hypothetical protein
VHPGSTNAPPAPDIRGVRRYAIDRVGAPLAFGERLAGATFRSEAS